MEGKKEGTEGRREGRRKGGKEKEKGEKISDGYNVPSTITKRRASFLCIAW